jgi:hypothetical protein
MNTEESYLEPKLQPSCLGAVSGSADYWLTAPMSEVKAFLANNVNNQEYEKKKSLLLDKIEDMRRREIEDRYIEEHCGNYTDKEKVIARNAFQVAWGVRKHYR